jgi:hypothetical protein
VRSRKDQRIVLKSCQSSLEFSPKRGITFDLPSVP